MKTTKHTPGPWKIAPEEVIDGRADIVILHDAFPLATVRGTDDMGCIEEDEESGIAEECVANAALIAAAPETAAERDRLKEALKAIITESQDGSLGKNMDLIAIRQIAKAALSGDTTPEKSLIELQYEKQAQRNNKLIAGVKELESINAELLEALKALITAEDKDLFSNEWEKARIIVKKATML